MAEGGPGLAVPDEAGGVMATTKMAPKKTAQALAPQTFAQWMQLAEMMAESNLVPTDFKSKPGDCLVAMQMGAAVGLNPFQAIQSIAVINGRPCMWGDAVLGIVWASGICEDVVETDDGQTATCTAKRKGKPTPTVRSFSMRMAKDAKVYVKGRDGQPGKWVSLSERPGPWQSYPERMRQMRARSWALRDTFPDVLKGLAIREEVEDYGDPEPGEPKNITPGGPTLEDRMADLMPKEKPVVIEQDPPAEKQPKPETDDLERGPAVVFDAPAPKPDAEAMMRKTDQVIIDVTQGAPGQSVQETPASTEREQPAKPKTRFTVGTQVFETNGINRAQMMELFKLYPRVAKRYGQEKAADVLKNEFHLEHRADLTEEQAEMYTIRLKEMLDAPVQT
jgi:hypothetical protein